MLNSILNPDAGYTLDDFTPIAQGVDFVSGSARGFMAPKGTPQECIDILAEAIGRATKTPEFLKATEAGSLQVIYRTGDEYLKALKEEAQP